MKEIVKENIRKQADRIMEVMKFSNPAQEKAIRTYVIANLVRSMKKSQRAGIAIFDARESRLFKFTNALRQSKNQEEFFKYLHEAFPKKSEMFLIKLIHQYQVQLLGAIQYSFPLDIPAPTDRKEIKEEKKSVDELQDIAIRSLTDLVSKLSDRLKTAEARVEELQMLMVRHKHNHEGKSYVEQIITK